MKTEFYTTSPGVLYCRSSSKIVQLSHLTELNQNAVTASGLRSRICTHPEPEAPLHEMIILHDRQTYVPPHCHLGKEESLHVVDGHADFLVFDESGVLISCTPLGPYASGKVWYLRTPEKVIHSLMIRSERFIFHEVTSGPFSRSATVFPLWSPSLQDEAGIERYRAQVEQGIQQIALFHGTT